MKRSVSPTSVSKHLPKGCTRPARFDELVLAARDPTRGGYFDIGWRDPRALHALEEDREPLAVTAGAAPRSFATIAKAFARALAEGEPAGRASDEAESVRAALVELGGAMVADRLLRRDLTRMFEPRDDWSVRLRVTRAGQGWTFEYVNEAAWHALPERYGIAPLWDRLRALCKRPKADLFHIEVARRGLVSVDRDKQFVALPGGMKLSEYLAKMQADMLRSARSQ